MINLKNIAMTAVSIATLTISAGAALAESGGEHVTNFDDVAWEQVAEGAEAAIVWGSEEDGDAVWAFRMQPGVEFPLHAHTNDYYGVAMQGTWVHIDADGNEVATGQDVFTLVKGGEMHGDRCEGPEVCINLIDFDGNRDMIGSE